MDQQNPNSTIKAAAPAADRKTVEKNRRDQMKALCSMLSSLVPNLQQSRGVVSLQDRLEGATDYIRKLEANLEKLREKKSRLQTAYSSGKSSGTSAVSLPSIEVGVVDSAMEIASVTGSNGHQWVFMETLRMLQEGEGAEVITASYSVLDHVVFHTIHSKIGESGPERYESAARISERLRKFVHGITKVNDSSS